MKGLPKRFWILLVLATGTVLLGTLGLLGRSEAGGGQYPGPGQLLDAVLEAIAYLTLNGFGPIVGDSPWSGWSLRIARLLALAFVVTGIGTLVDALLGEFGDRRFQWRARGLFGPRELDLVCGLAGPGLSFIDNACADDQARNRRTLAIDAAPSAQAIDACRRRGVPLLAGDASVLARLRFERIARIFVASGSDDANLRIVFRLAECTRAAGTVHSPARTPCVVHLADTATHAALLKALPPDHGLDLRVFNTETVTVRELYRSHPLDRFGPAYAARAGNATPPAGVHLVVLGDGAMADELLLQALQLNIHEPSLSLRVDVLSGDPAHAAGRWQSRHACHPHRSDMGNGGIRLAPDEVWQAERVLPAIDFHALPGSPSTRIAWCQAHCGRPGWATTFVIAVPDASTAATVALELAESLRVLRENADVELWIHVRGGYLADVARLFHPSEIAGKDTANGWIRLFGDYLGECRRDLAVASQIEEAAQRVNRVYDLGAGTDEAVFISDRTGIEASWRRCGEADRDSSRQAAAHAWVKRRIAARIDLPRELAHMPPALREHVGTDPLKLLATVEHRRWCAQQLLAGMAPLFTYPSGNTIEQWNAEDVEKARAWFGSNAAKKSWQRRRRHADLVPFASLAYLNALGINDAAAAYLMLGDREQAKDLALSRLTDYVIGDGEG